MVGHATQEGTEMSSPFEKKDGAEGTNLHAKTTDCQTCGGDRFVTVRLRSPEQTAWMAEKNIRPSRTSFFEEVAPCPDCHRGAYDLYWPGRIIDPAAAREAISR